MAPGSTPGIDQLILRFARDVISTITDRPSESPDQRVARAEEAYLHIAAYEPKTPLEVMAAAQAVLFKSMALDAARDANRAETPEEARRFRQQATSLSRT